MTDANPNEIVRAHVWVTGRVQNVGFRAFVQESGALLRLTGWVRNVSYDRVEAVAEGRARQWRNSSRACRPVRVPPRWTRRAWNGRRRRGSSATSASGTVFNRRA